MQILIISRSGLFLNLCLVAFRKRMFLMISPSQGAGENPDVYDFCMIKV